MTPEGAGRAVAPQIRPTPPAEAPPPGEPWTVLRMILWSAAYLEGKGVERARLDAEYLLADTLELDRLQLYLQFDRPLNSDELTAYRPRLKRRAAREPLQYVLGKAAFRNLDLSVDPRVLIPRPETEGLVERVIAWANTREPDGLSVLDVGTGSGAIVLALATESVGGRFVATDSSPRALEVAALNAAAYGVELDCRVGRFFDPIAPGETFDIVVSNPPYVLESERSELAPEVQDHEPWDALFAGVDGLDAVRALFEGAARVVEPGGLMALEIGAGQGTAVLELAQGLDGFEPARLYRDLSSRDRYVILTAQPQRT